MNTLEPRQDIKDPRGRAAESELIALAYDAACESVAWTTFFADLRSSLRGEGWTLVIRGHGPARYVSLDSPSTGFATVNPGNVFKNGALSQQSFILAYVGKEFVDEWSQLRLAVARESSGAQGWPAAGISVFKGGDEAPLDHARFLLRVLLPHLKRALAMFFRTQKLTDERDALKTCLDELSDAVFIVDASAQILDRNRAGTHYLNGDYGIVEDTGRFRLTVDEHDVAFRRDLKQATSGSRGLRGKELDSGCTLWVHGVGSSQALIFITKGRTPRTIAPQLLRDALGITPAQARVVSFFMSGLTLDTIAHRLDLSLHTVRLHLKQVQAKTGARRQASLALEILGCIPRVGDPS